MVLGEMVAVNYVTRRKSINTPLDGKSEILFTEAYGTCTGVVTVPRTFHVLYYRLQNNICGSSVHM